MDREGKKRKEQEGSRGGKKSIGIEKGETDRVTESQRKTARQKGHHHQGWICPSLPALARGQREVGAL